jgi:hypothetical protein
MGNAGVYAVGGCMQPRDGMIALGASVQMTALHPARMRGLQRALPQLAGTALIGALIMVSADRLGRSFGPAGLVAA